MSPSVLTRPAPVAPPPLVAWLPSYLALSVIWGSSFLFIKVGVAELHPAYVTLIRCTAGALTLLVVLLLTRTRLPRGRRLWAELAGIAFLGNVLPFTLFGYGELHVSSIVAGIWNAATPLMVLVFALAFLPEERPTVRRISGLAIGFAGVLVVLGVWRGLGSGELIGQLFCAGAAACYGVAIPWTRRVVARTPTTGVSLPATQLLLAALQLAVLAPLLAGRPPSPGSLSGGVIASVLALGALGTGLAFSLSYGVIRVAGATTAASVTYLMPIVATVLGIVVLGEGMHWYEPVGAVVILTGVAISQGLRAPARWPFRARASDPATDKASAGGPGAEVGGGAGVDDAIGLDPA